MKHILSALAILQLVTAKPQQNKDAIITSYENINNGQGNFKFSFQTSNGITQQQEGQPKIVNSASTVTVIRGLFSVIVPENGMHEVHYISDENGYRSRFSIAASNLGSFNTRSLNKQEEEFIGIAHINTEAQKVDKNGSQSFMPALLHVGNTTTNSTNQTASKEFPDRIGTPAIITLQG